MTVEERYKEFLTTRGDDAAQMQERYRQYLEQNPLPAKTPNPKNEAITGSKQPRIVGLPPGTMESFVEGAGATGGATEGAVYGGRLGMPFGPMGATIGAVGGGILGAGVGLAGTRAGVEGGKAALGMRPPITADEAIASGQRALMEGVAGEGLFRSIAAVPQGGKALLRKFLAGEIKPAERAVYDDAAQIGVHLTPSTLTENQAPKMVESTLRRSLAGRGKFTANDINNEVALRDGVDQWADEALGHYRGPVEQGQLIQKVLKNEVIPEQRQFVKALYANLDAQTGGEKIVDTKDLYEQLQGIRGSLARRGDTHASALSAVDDVLERISKKGPLTGLTVTRETEPIIATFPNKPDIKVTKEVTKKGTPDLQSVERGTKPYDKGFVIPGEAEETAIRRIETKKREQQIQVGERMTGLVVTEKSDAPRTPIPLTFADAQEIRSILGSEIGHGGPALPANDQQKLKQVYALMSEKMGEAAIDFSKKTGKDINLSWALADTMNKRSKQLFNDSVLAKVIDRNPEDVVKTVFQKNAITETKDLVRSLETKPETLNAYRRGVVEHLIQEAMDKNTGRVVGANFAKAAMSRGEPVLKETFGENYGNFKRILEVAERMPKQNETGLAWFEQGLYIGGLAGVVSGQVAGSPTAVAASVAPAAAWLIGTRTLSGILADKTKTDKLLAAYKMNPKTQAFARAMTQLGAIEVGEYGQPLEGTNEPRMGVMTGIAQKLME